MKVSGILRKLQYLGGDRHGGAAVEFALTAGILLFAALSIIELARFIYSANSMENSVRSGLRMAVVSGANSDNPTSAAAITSFVRDRATAAGLKPAQQNVNTAFSPDSEPGSTVTISAAYEFTLLVPLPGLSSLTISLDRSATIIN